MKKLFMITALILCLLMISCREEYSCGGPLPEITVADVSEETTAAEETTGELMWSVCVDWMDFIRVNGVVYDGGFENRTLDESLVGERLGEVLYTVKSYYESEEELSQADKRDFTAAFRSIGCELFAVRDDENSIAVLDDGKYYLYSVRSVTDFNVFGGEKNGLPSPVDESYGVVINSYDELCLAFGGAENVPDEIKARYSGKALEDKTLIAVVIVSGWGGTEYGIFSVNKIGSDFCVNALQFDADADGDDAMHYWTFYIETEKTQGGEVEVQIEKCAPLKNDSALETQKTPSGLAPEDIHLYEGKPVTNRYAAEEAARTACGHALGEVTVRFDPAYNYWLVSHVRSTDSGYLGGLTVIRAADGRILDHSEEGIEFPE